MREEWVPLHCVFHEFHADAGRIRDDQKSVLKRENPGHDFALGWIAFTPRVLLQCEIGNARRKLNAGGRTHRAERIVRYHPHVVRLGEGRDLFAVGDSASHTDIRPHVLYRVPRQEHFEFVDRMDAFPGRNRNRDLLRHFGHSVEVVGTDWILEEIGAIGFNAPAQNDRLGRVQPTVYLDTQVHIVANRLAVGRHCLNGILNLVRVGFEIRDVSRLIQKWRQVSHGRIPLRLGLNAASQKLLFGTSDHVPVDTGFVPAFATQKLVDGHAEKLARDIPEGDINRTQGSHNRRAAKMRAPIQYLPVVFDSQGVLANEIFPEALDHLSRRLQVSPCARFTQPHKSLIRKNLDKEIPIDRQDLHVRYLHALFSFHFRR